MGKRVFMAIITIASISLIVGVQAFGVAKANPFWGVYPVAPNQDKPIVLVETPGNYSTITEENVTLNFTVIKPISWNMSVAPFGTCANGRIDSVNVSLNGVEKFQEFLWDNNLNGGDSWNKSYSVSVGGLNSGINALEIAVSANALYFNSTNNTVSLSPMNVKSTLYLNSSEASPTPTNNPTPTSSPTQTPKLEPNPTLSKREDNFTSTAIMIGLVAVIIVVGIVVYFGKLRLVKKL